MTAPLPSDLRDPMEEALAALPISPAPPSLPRGVMRRVRALSEAPKFSIRWLDLALSLFGGMMFSTVAWMAFSMTPATWIRLRAFALSIWHAPAGNFSAGGLTLALLAAPPILLFAVWLFLPRRRNTISARR